MDDGDPYTGYRPHRWVVGVVGSHPQVQGTIDSITNSVRVTPEVVCGPDFRTVAAAISRYGRGNFACIVWAGDKITPWFLVEAESLMLHGAGVVYPSVHEFGTRNGFASPLSAITGDMVIDGADLPASCPFQTDLMPIGPVSDQGELWVHMAKAGARFVRAPGINYLRRS